MASDGPGKSLATRLQDSSRKLFPQKRRTMEKPQAIVCWVINYFVHVTLVGISSYLKVHLGELRNRDIFPLLQEGQGESDRAASHVLMAPLGYLTSNLCPCVLIVVRNSGCRSVHPLCLSSLWPDSPHPPIRNWGMKRLHPTLRRQDHPIHSQTVAIFRAGLSRFAKHHHSCAC